MLIKTLQILGLEVCADIMVGDEMVRGISGGQKKRVTTGKALIILLPTGLSLHTGLVIENSDP